MAKNSISGSTEDWITNLSIGISKNFNDISKGEEFIDIMVDGTEAFNNEVASRGFTFNSCGVILTVMLTRKQIDKVFRLLPMLYEGPMKNDFTIGLLSVEYDPKTNKWKSNPGSYPRVYVIESFDNLKNVCDELCDDVFKDEVTLTETSRTVDAGFTLLQKLHKYHGFWQLIRGIIRKTVPIEYAVRDLVDLGYLKYKRGN